MKRRPQIHGACILSLTLILFCQGRGICQLGIPIHDPQEDRLTTLYNQSRLFSREGRVYDALNLAEEALQLAMIEDKNDSELKILELMGDIYYSADQSASAIPYFLRAAGIMESRKDTSQLESIYLKIAKAYNSEKVYSKEQEYYESLLNMLAPGQKEEELSLRSRIGIAAFHNGNLVKSVEVFTGLLKEFEVGSDQWLKIGQDIITAYDAAEKYDSALVYCLEILPWHQAQGNAEQVIRQTNNIGYYYTLLGDYPNASSSYLTAIQQAENTALPVSEIALMKSNSAVCFTNMGREKDAVRQFNDAIRLLEGEGNLAEKSRNENMLANLYHSTGDLYNAALFSRNAMNSARLGRDRWREAQAYLTYSEVLRDGNDPVNALEYYEKYLAIRDSIEFSRQVELQEMENKKNLLERQERALKLRLKEEEVSELAIRELRLQNEKMEKDQEILIQMRNLELLKQDSLRQSIIIKDQQYLVARREKENILLEQEKQLAGLKLKEEEQAKLAAEREKQMSDQKLQLAELETERQKADKNALIGGVVGIAILAGLILSSLVSTRRKNQLLGRQKKEIEQKNQDLEQKNEEISAQRDEIEAQRNLVFDQKLEIEAYNDEILKSIEYAKRLQAAALPVFDILQGKVKDQFVLFRPRDVVSGDFYWFAEVEDKLVVTVADCTGHGVPGAFMSMMGMSLLKELVQKEYITHPGVILRRLRKEIINTMGQKGITGEQRDGMDMALITIDSKEQKIDFAGAYNSMYLVRYRNQPAPVIDERKLVPDLENKSLCLYEIPADKMPIAHFDRMEKFRNHEIKILTGDTFYLYTDGFADQFGGPKGKKFMYKPFKQLILHCSKKSMAQQQRILSETLDKWMGEIAQVDDICVMGIRF